MTDVIRHVSPPCNAAQAVTPRHRILLVEGNYLLLNDPAWAGIKPCLDISVMLDVPVEELERRLIQRWLDHDHTAESARERALSNDIPNAHRVIEDSVCPDFRLKSVRQ